MSSVSQWPVDALTSGGVRDSVQVQVSLELSDHYLTIGVVTPAYRRL